METTSAQRKIKFLLINPTSPLWQIEAHQRPANSSVFRFSMLPSLYVAASMPGYVDTQILDEDVEPIDYNTDADIIGISFMTYNAPRAYELGDRFREMGKTVIFGGYHPTFMPDEAIAHADAVCIGEAEPNVPQIIKDFMTGELKPFYKSELFDLSKLPKLDRNLLKSRAYITLNAMQATRGCYNRCEFCSVAAFNRYQIRTRPVGDIIDEMKTLGKYILFMDDNITQNREFALEMFKAMIPLKKIWFSQCSITIAFDDELLEMAVKSGCRGLFLGFESLSQQSLQSWKKDINRRKDYMEVAQKLHRNGMEIFGAFVFGSDDDTSDVFAETLDFLLDANIETLQSTRLTPFPGTPMFNKMDAEGRILDKDWSHYDFFHVVHEPKQMSRNMLDYGTAWIQEQFYSYKNIARRVSRSAAYLHPNLVLRTVIPLNFGYRRKLSAYDAFVKSKYFEDSLAPVNSLPFN